MEEKTDILSAIKIQQGMLEKTATWPKRSKTPFYKFRQMLCWVIDLTMASTLFMELKLNLAEQDYKHMTELLSFMASEISYILKNAIFLKNSNKFMDTVDRLKDPLLSQYPMVCDKHVVNGTKYSKLMMRTYQYFVINLVFIYLLKPWFTKDNSAIRFEVFNLGVFRLPVHFFQVIAIGLACWNNSSLDVLALGLISIGTAQFEILRDKLINIRKWAGFSYEEVDRGAINESTDTNEESEAKVNVRIKECVKHHLAIINYAAALEDVYTYYFLVQFVDSVLAICNTWFQFMMADDILNIIFLVFYSASLVTQLGIYCLYGNTITLKSAEIRDACYFSEWYNCGPAVKKSLMIIMERSKRPTILTAGKFSILGLASFSSLMQSSYSYFALMNRLYGN